MSVLQYDKKTNRAGNYALKIRAIAGNAPGRFYEQLSIVTDLPGNPIIRFPIYGNVRSDNVAQGDGTRDQLYLALRIASLEQHVKAGTILPFIIDDILIEFDDDRARAALEVLSETSDLTQILYFTHHNHIVEMARHSLDASSLVVHELGLPGAA